MKKHEPGEKMMNRRRRIVLAGFICMITVPQMILGEGGRRSGAGLFDTLPGPAWLGCALIGAEYLLGPLVASQYWWKEGLSRNPFENIVESEPYLEDKIWHCANGATLTDLHYWTLNKFFNSMDTRHYESLHLNNYSIFKAEIIERMTEEYSAPGADEANKIRIVTSMKRGYNKCRRFGFITLEASG